MSLLDSLDVVLQPAAKDLFDLAQRVGVKPRVTSARRTYAQQQSLYEAYVAGRARYPAAPPGTSAHEYGFAFDMVVTGAVNQADLGTVWRSWGGVAGGEEDPVHFEYGGWRSLVTVQDLPPPMAAAPPVLSPSTPGTTTAQALDILLSVLPTPIAGIIGTAGLAEALLSLLGPSWETEVLYWASHPAQFVQWFYDEWWAILRASYGF